MNGVVDALAAQGVAYNVLNAAYGGGADPTGAADSTAAISAAIAAAAAQPAAVVFFPPGTYKTTGGHVIPANVSVIGAGKGITTLNHRGVGTYCFFIGSSTGGANPPNYMGKVSGFTISGQSAGNGTGPFGQQVGIKVLNCLFFNLQDLHFTLLYEAMLIDGGDENALGAGTFAGNGYVANCTSSNVYIGLHVYRWVTDTLYAFCYGYGNSPITSGSVGAWFDTKPATSTMSNLSYEGFDTGYLISTSQSGLCFLNPRVENCNALVSYQNGTSGHTVVGGNHPSNWTASAAQVYANPASASQIAGVLTAYRQVSSAATPNAALGVLGNPVTLASESGFSGLQPTALLFTASGVSGETITIQTVTTYTDNTANTVNLTTTSSSGTVTISLSGMISLLGGSDGRICKSVAFSIKSSINNSTASLTMTLAGLNLP